MGSYHPRRRKSLADRFWSKVDTSGECWEWTGAHSFGGYGQMSVPGPPPQRPVRAHRISYELANGPIPDGMCVLHHCDNPPCVRPDHLFLGTLRDNSQDMSSKGRSRRGRTAERPDRIKRGSELPQAQLTADDVRAIRAAYDSSRGIYRRLGRQYGVSWGTIRHVIMRETWRHID